MSLDHNNPQEVKHFTRTVTIHHFLKVRTTKNTILILLLK